MRRFWSLALMLLTACSTTDKSQEPDKLYRAHGDTWLYVKAEFRTKYLGLNSPHGIIGTRNRYEESHVVASSAARRISIPDSLYALQKDGTFKKIECCKYFREKGDLYNIDDKLVFVFENARRFITDCFIYPARRPNNEFEDPEKQVFGIRVFADFDPTEAKFKVSTFSAGDYPEDEYWTYEREKGYAKGRMPIAESMAFAYSKRKPFLCDDPRAVPQK